jgi:site-specific DNA recombinase
MELESLVVPAANAAEEAGNLINNLKNLWAEATVEEQRKLLLTMLDGVYIDAKQTKSIVLSDQSQRLSLFSRWQ